jgi:UDP-glucose 4-epimerase
MGKKVIVTGGAGYIGSHTVVELIQFGYEPIILDDFRNAQPWIIDRLTEITGSTPIVHEVDCQNQAAVEAVFDHYGDINGVIHFAADKAVGESVNDPLKYYQNNIGSLCSVMRAVEKKQIRHFVFSSSCTVYGEVSDPVVTENHPVQAANSPYGDTKITCEKIIQYTQHASDHLSAVLLRYFNPIGAHPSARIGELPQGVPNNLVPYITQTAKGIREKLTVFGNDYNTPDGTNVRDYIHVVDLARAHVKALEYLQNTPENKCEVFNLGTGKGTSVLEIIESFEKVNGLKLNYEIGARRPGDVAQIYADASKAEKELNWTCKYTVQDALKHSWEWEKGIELKQN